MWYVYKITNMVNGKLYVGKTDNIKKRWNGHKTAARRQDPNDFTILHRAMRKHGFDNFKIEHLSEHKTEVEALTEEVRMIAELGTRNRDIGYNMTDGGDGASGHKHTSEAKQKMSEARKGKYIGENNPFYGKQHSKEMRAFLSQHKKDMLQANPKKYDQINLQQCAIDTKECIRIQQRYLQGDISMETLCEEYSVPITTIFHIIRGTYFAIRGHSILTEEMVDQIIQKRLKNQGATYKSFTPEQEREIAEKYRTSNLSTGDLAKEYNVSGPTIRKALEANGITIDSNQGRRTNNTTRRGTTTSLLALEQEQEIANRYLTDRAVLAKDLAKEYGVSLPTIRRILRAQGAKRNKRAD